MRVGREVAHPLDAHERQPEDRLSLDGEVDRSALEVLGAPRAPGGLEAGQGIAFAPDGGEPEERLDVPWASRRSAAACCAAGAASPWRFYSPWRVLLSRCILQLRLERVQVDHAAVLSTAWVPRAEDRSERRDQIREHVVLARPCLRTDVEHPVRDLRPVPAALEVHLVVDRRGAAARAFPAGTPTGWRACPSPPRCSASPSPSGRTPHMGSFASSASDLSNLVPLVTVSFACSVVSGSPPASSPRCWLSVPAAARSPPRGGRWCAFRSGPVLACLRGRSTASQSRRRRGTRRATCCSASTAPARAAGPSACRRRRPLSPARRSSSGRSRAAPRWPAGAARRR